MNNSEHLVDLFCKTVTVRFGKSDFTWICHFTVKANFQAVSFPWDFQFCLFFLDMKHSALTPKSSKISSKQLLLLWRLILWRLVLWRLVLWRLFLWSHLFLLPLLWLSQLRAHPDVQASHTYLNWLIQSPSRYRDMVSNMYGGLPTPNSGYSTKYTSQYSPSSSYSVYSSRGTTLPPTRGASIPPPLLDRSARTRTVFRYWSKKCFHLKYGWHKIVACKN